jgi:hypothetical protein
LFSKQATKGALDMVKWYDDSIPERKHVLIIDENMYKIREDVDAIEAPYECSRTAKGLKGIHIHRRLA